MIENNYCVYMHVNKINGKKYIGISSNVKRRWSGNGKQYYDQVFGIAIQKYGWDNFDHQIIKDNLSKAEACTLEQELIKKYNTRDKEFGYNRSDGGDCGSKGAFNTQLKRIRKVYQYDLDGNFIKEFPSIAEALREVAPHIKNSGNISLCCKYKRNQAYGFQWFYEFKGYKIDKCQTREEITSKCKSKEVYQYSFEGTFIKKYDSVALAEKETENPCISQCARGDMLSSGNYRWFYTYQGEKIEPYERVSYNSKKIYKCKGDKIVKTYSSKSKAAKENNMKKWELDKIISNNIEVDGFYYKIA